MEIIEEIKKLFKPTTSVSVNVDKSQYDKDMDEKIALSRHPKGKLGKDETYGNYIDRKTVHGGKVAGTAGAAIGAGLSGSHAIKAGISNMTRKGVKKVFKAGPEFGDAVKTILPATGVGATALGIAGAVGAHKMATQKIKHGHYDRAKK